MALRTYAIGVGRDERAMRALGELAATVRAGGGVTIDDTHPS